MKTDLIYSPTLNLKIRHKYPWIITLKIHEFSIYCCWQLPLINELIRKKLLVSCFVIVLHWAMKSAYIN